MKEKPENTEGNNANHAYSERIDKSEIAFIGNNGNGVHKGPDDYKDTQKKETPGLAVPCISEP